MIRQVFFDVGATLITPEPSMGAIYHEALGPMGVATEPEEFPRVFERIWRDMSRRVGSGRNRFAAYPGGEMGYWRAYVGEVLAELRAGADRDTATAALHAAFARPESWQIYDDVAPVLAHLREDGIRCGIISNWDSRLPDLLAALGLKAAFDPIVFSAEAGAEKPSSEIYRAALSRAGVEPAEALHVGDDAEADAQGARDSGLHALLIDRGGRAAGEQGSIRSLLEIPAALTRLVKA